MRKAERDLIALARTLGVEKPRVVVQMPHARLCGSVKGKDLTMVVSLTKAFATPKYSASTKRTIKRAVEACSK